MPVPRVRLKVDWNNDLDFADSDEDLSADLLSWTCSRGREFASTLEATSTAGKLSAILNNFDGKYSPSNVSGPLFGSLLANRRVLLTHEPPLGLYGHFNGETSVLSHADDVDLLNPFDGGGTIEYLLRPYSDGGSNLGAIIRHGSWRTRVQEESNGFVKLWFRQNFSISNGRWATTDAIAPLFQFARVTWVYDADSPSNNPTLFLKLSDGNIQVLTVGNGLDELMTPAGTRVSNVGNDILVGGASVSTNVFDGDIDDIRLFNIARTQAQIDDDAFVEISTSTSGLILYMKLSDLSDATGNVTDFTNNAAVTFLNDHIWYGYVHDIVPKPAQRGRKLAVLEAFGSLAQFTEENVELPMSTSIAAGDAIDDILDELGWPAGDRDVDTGQSLFARFWSPSTSALKLLRSVEKSENGFIVEDRNGDLRFEDRHRRLLAPHTVSQATLDDAITSTLRYHNPEQQNPRQFIRNSFTLDVRTFIVGSLATLWALPETGANSPLLAPGQSRTFKALYPVADSPSEDVGVDAWTTPVESTDWVANRQSDGGGVDGSADVDLTDTTKRGNSMAFTLTNNGVVVLFLTTVQARGTPVSQSDPIPMKSEDAASIALFKTRSFHLSEHYISSSQDGQNWCDHNVSIFANEIPVVDVELWANTTAFHLFKVARLDVSDRITFKALTLSTQLGIDEDCFIETIRSSMGEDRILRTKYSISPASGYSNFWILGTSELGVDTIAAY